MSFTIRSWRKLKGNSHELQPISNELPDYYVLLRLTVSQQIGFGLRVENVKQ